MNDLIKTLYDNRDAKNIPNMSKDKWDELNKTYDKETIIAGLISYIQQYKPEPPMNPVSEQDMIKCFFDLQSSTYNKFFIEHDQVKDKVLEKFDDYGKPYKDHGLGIIQMGNGYIDVSNYFNQKLRMECDVYGFKSPHYRWKNNDDLRSIFLALWRLGNDRLNEHSFVVAFRLAAYIATQFKPHVAKTLYEMTNAKTIFDSSCGWGDRLAGFYCTPSAREYYGCDPNEQVFEMYKQQCIAYEKLLGGNPVIQESEDHFVIEGKTKRVEIWRSAAEDLDYSKLPLIDLAFTSPPYFSTELYNSNGKNVDDQSWKRYDEYEKWREGFYLPVNRLTFERLSDQGLLIVNIQDPKIKTKRYYASDDLIKDLTTKYNECKFIGQVGMRIMQRPKNIAKEKLLKHFDQIYIEPMWVFGKNRDYFMKKNEGLLNFMD